MKESIKSCFEKAEEERLDGFFEKYEGEEMPEDSLSRLRERLLGKSIQKATITRGFRRLIPALAAAACLLLGLGIAYKAGVFNRINALTPTGPDATQSAYAEPDTTQSAYSEAGSTHLPAPADTNGNEAVKLYPSTKTKDKLDIRSLPEGASQSVQADRDLYRYVRFFESGDKVYAIMNELSGIFSFNGESFARSGPALNDVLYFNGGAYDGYVYMPGNWYCWGQDSGLYRFELETGRIERFVSTDETVVSVAADGPVIYYSSYKGNWYSNAEKYSLKSVNLDTGEISVLIENASHSIYELKCSNGNLYFRSYYKGIFYVTPDMYLHKIGIDVDGGYISSYAVDGEIVYYQTVLYGQNYSTVIEAFDHEGVKLAEYKAVRYSENANAQNYVSFREFTIYNGRLVCYDDNGAYLLDIAIGEREKIMDRIWQDYDYQTIPYQTVYNGRLYIGIGNAVYEYYGGSVREFDLADEYNW